MSSRGLCMFFFVSLGRLCAAKSTRNTICTEKVLTPLISPSCRRLRSLKRTFNGRIGTLPCPVRGDLPLVCTESAWATAILVMVLALMSGQLLLLVVLAGTINVGGLSSKQNPSRFLLDEIGESMLQRGRHENLKSLSSYHPYAFINQRSHSLSDLSPCWAVSILLLHTQ